METQNTRRALRWAAMAGLAIVFLVLGLVGGVALDRRVLISSFAPDNIPSNATSEFRLMAQAWNTIQQSYVDRSAVQPQKLIYGAISGMIDSLGDTGHSRFQTPAMRNEENNAMQGQFEGIGVEVDMKNNLVTVVAPIDGSPAQKAGIKAGDAIVKVNGQDVTGQSLDQVVPKILGPAGTQVTITILEAKTGKTRDVTLTRARIQLQNVTWQQIPGTSLAHVRIAAFSQNVTPDLVAALQDIQKQGLTGVVLDLRNDPGGLLDESVGTASQFLGSGNVLLEKDAKGNITPVPVKPGGVATQMPLVVLINNGTASAAEIVSGALQDPKRAQLVGETTFGTGTVLQDFPLSDGSSLLLATQEWLTPNKRVIWHKGITPDVTVTLPANVDPLFPEAEKGMTAAQLQASQDAQLLKAVSILQAEVAGKKNSQP